MVFSQFPYVQVHVHVCKGSESQKLLLTSAVNLFTSSSAAFSSDAEAGDRFVRLTFDPGDALFACSLDVAATCMR